MHRAAELQDRQHDVLDHFFIAALRDDKGDVVNFLGVQIEVSERGPWASSRTPRQGQTTGEGPGRPGRGGGGGAAASGPPQKPARRVYTGSSPPKASCFTFLLKGLRRSHRVHALGPFACRALAIDMPKVPTANTTIVAPWATTRARIIFWESAAWPVWKVYKPAV